MHTDYDSKQVIQKLIDGSKCQDKQENITIKKIRHEAQCDFSIANAFATGTFITQVYQLHMSLMLCYLSKLDQKICQQAGHQSKAYFDATAESQRVEAMAKEWLVYEQKM